MKIASFNVNSIRARLPVLLDWLARNRPDILCLQETKVTDEDFPADAFQDTGYNFVFKGQKSYNGVAIFSTAPISNPSFGLDSDPPDQPRLARATIQGITVVNTYIPQGVERISDKFQYKLQWFARLRDYFDRNFRPTDKILWVGDLNVAPEPIDVYDPEALLGHVCFCPEVTQALYAVKNWGFTDIFRKHCPDPGQYTFWDYRLRNSLARNRGWRLDHILATQPLANVSAACFIDKNPRSAEKPSDHTPIIADFAL